MSRLHVMLIISSLGGGGAERVISELTAFLAERGYPVTLATLEGDGKDHYALHPEVRRVRLNIMWESRGLFGRLASTYRRLRMIRRTVRQTGADVVISFIDTTNVRILLSLMGAGIPVIVSERIDPRHHPIGCAWKFLRYCTYPFAARVVVQTRGVAAWASKWLPAQRLQIIPNAVRPFDQAWATIRPSGMPAGPVLIGVGRLEWQKGFDLLIRAFSASRLPQAGWSLVILGEGSERANLSNLVSHLELDQRVILAGLQENPEEWLRHADLFALSSRYEGFPNALIEAMQCALASVAFNCESGPSEIIRHGVDGWLVPADDVNAFSEALCMLGQNITLRTALGEAAAVVVSHRFSPESIYGEWAAVCDSVIQSSY